MICLAGGYRDLRPRSRRAARVDGAGTRRLMNASGRPWPRRTVLFSAFAGIAAVLIVGAAIAVHVSRRARSDRRGVGAAARAGAELAGRGRAVRCARLEDVGGDEPPLLGQKRE